MQSMANENTNSLIDDFAIIWLDNGIEKTKGNRDTKVFIRQLVKHRLLTYDDPDKCIDDITDGSIKRVFLIVSNAFGPNVIPVIHEISYIQAIYVFCGDQQKAQAWAGPYSKISGIFTKRPALLQKIRNDISAYNTDEDLPMSVFHLAERENTLQELTEESATFMWYQSIMIVLRLMALYGNAKTDMIAECRKIYHNNESVQKSIDNFEKYYCPIKAFEWYTCDSFVYRLLNKALRTQDIDIIFKFRFFINDLHNQIEELHHRYLDTLDSTMNHQLTVYRGQLLSLTELNVLKRSVNGLISMNSFLSTTLNQELAKVFADTGDTSNKPSSLQSVLFIIDINSMSKETTPFAILKQFWCCQGDEDEVLFSIGAIFKIQSVKQHENMWHVRLQLSKEQNDLSQSLSKHMLQQIGSEPDPVCFGWFLYRMSEFNKAERYVEYILKELPQNDKAIGNAYNLLGLICKNAHKLQESVTNYKKALTIYSQVNCHNSPQVIATHCNLGLAFLALGDIQNAEEQQLQAEQKLLTSRELKNSLVITSLRSLKAQVQAAYGNNEVALQELKLVLETKKKKLPANHFSIASTLNVIGIVQEKMDHNVEALESFQQALEIGKKSLPPEHMDLAEYHTNIGRIYDKQKQFKLALEQFELAIHILENYREEEHDKITELHRQIVHIRVHCINQQSSDENFSFSSGFRNRFHTYFHDIRTKIHNKNK
ncbi:unnamed protein product [Rotaria sp. Silwood1]|nr:unnamed protein product [Rotaria sp. Silwood1]CAF3612581.1 unnamed protein product [Rotaria sp. Silwood1]CAF3639103.1 unnamed protein product [Rotaria sp. Silwood1]CAF3670165.1 unnamed protein product [Rotaria sp. Silwood1]CAF4533052.1 unnamed protein product [Rotaria sp. Silwood1]